MAWLEQDFDEVVHVVVIEVRDRAVWQRAGKRGTRGRTIVLTEHDTAAEAAAAGAARIAALIADGYAVVDAAAGVDARAPAGSAAPAAPADPPATLRAGDLDAALRAALPPRPAARDLLAAFAAVMTAPRAFRAHGYRCDLTGRGRVVLAVIVTDPEGGLTAAGYTAAIEVPADRAWIGEDYAAIEEPWAVFAAGLAALDAWAAVADLACARVAVESTAV